MPWFRPTWRKALGLGIAAVITGITFTITSTIPPVAPMVAKPALRGTARMASKAPMVANDREPACREKRSNSSQMGCGL